MGEDPGKCSLTHSFLQVSVFYFSEISVCFIFILFLANPARVLKIVASK